MLHTFVGADDDAVKSIAREPMKNYLRSAMFLVKDAAWHFPAFKDMSAETGRGLDHWFENMSEDELDALLDFAFERYYDSSGLFGNPARCVEMVDSLKEIEVDEVACLVDYGIDTEQVLTHLENLNEVRRASRANRDLPVSQDHGMQRSSTGMPSPTCSARRRWRPCWRRTPIPARRWARCSA